MKTLMAAASAGFVLAALGPAGARAAGSFAAGAVEAVAAGTPALDAPPLSMAAGGAVMNWPSISCAHTWSPTTRSTCAWKT